MPKDYRLGILFVHGIGEQPKAETLLTSAEPLVQWLRRALGDNRQIRIMDARLNLGGGAQDQPAHAAISIESKHSAGHPDENWLMAESWWGGEIRRPPFFKLAGWMLTTGAWMIISHFLRNGHSAKGMPATIGRIAKVTFIAVPLVILSQLAILILSVLALTPLPNVRTVLCSVLLKLTGIIGDTYVFVDNKTQQTAIICEVIRHLDWLSKRCDKVAVIAHSQGAAVAHRALHRAQIRNAELLITYGSGLAKIEEIEHITANSPADFRAAYLTIPLALAGAIASSRVLHSYRGDGNAWMGMIWGLMPFVYLLLVCQRAREYRDVLDKRMQALGFTRGAGPCLTWHDIYSTADLVPGGRLGEIQGLSSQVVMNRGSWLTDHTSYWRNTSEFLPYVSTQLAKLTGLEKSFIPAIGDNIDRVSREHRGRVSWLVNARRAIYASAAVAPLMFLDRLPAIGDTAIRTLRQPLTEIVGGWITGPSPTVVGALLLSLAILIWQPFYALIWTSWDRRGATEIFGRTEAETFFERYLTQFLYIAIGFVPAAVLALCWAAPELLVTDRLEVRIYHLLGWIFLLLAGTVLVAGIVRQSLVILKTMMWKEVGMLIYMVGFASLFFIFVVPGLASDNLQSTLAASVAVALLGAKLINVHLDWAAKIITPALKAAALAIPFVASALVAIFDPRENPEFKDRITTAIGLYLWTVLILVAVVALSERRRKQHPSTRSKAARV